MLHNLFTFQVDRSLLVFRYDCVLLYCCWWSVPYERKHQLERVRISSRHTLYLVYIREFRGMENWADRNMVDRLEIQQKRLPLTTTTTQNSTWKSLAQWSIRSSRTSSCNNSSSRIFISILVVRVSLHPYRIEQLTRPLDLVTIRLAFLSLCLFPNVPSGVYESHEIRWWYPVTQLSVLYRCFMSLRESAKYSAKAQNLIDPKSRLIAWRWWLTLH
jgi:hypothetical protein